MVYIYSVYEPTLRPKTHHIRVNDTEAFKVSKDADTDVVRVDTTNSKIIVGDGTNTGTISWDGTNFTLQSDAGSVGLTANSGVIQIPSGNGSGNPRFAVRAGSGGDTQIELGETSVSHVSLFGDGGFDQFSVRVRTTAGRQMVLVDYDTGVKDFDHAAVTDPVFYIHSTTDPDSDNTQYGSFVHNQTNFVISSGAGNIFLNPASVVQFGTFTALGGEMLSGYITIADAAGNSRKIAVVA